MPHRQSYASDGLCPQFIPMPIQTPQDNFQETCTDKSEAGIGFYDVTEYKYEMLCVFQALKIFSASTHFLWVHLNSKKQQSVLHPYWEIPIGQCFSMSGVLNSDKKLSRQSLNVHFSHA